VIALLDTSVLVRYLTGEPPDQAERATALIEGDQELCVPVIALVETAYVLSTVYGVERARRGCSDRIARASEHNYS
jgi:predicted nucleic acid-binding protein